MHSKSERYCRVCGLDNGEEGVRDKYGYSTFFICDCCGIEFGYGDETKDDCISARTNWLAQKMEWWNKKKKSSDWNADEQLKNIPKAYIDIEALSE